MTQSPRARPNRFAVVAGRCVEYLARRAKRAKAWETGARYYRWAVRLTPQRAQAWVQLGHCLKEGGRKDEAAQAYARAFELDPSQRGVLRDLTYMCQQGVDERLKARLREVLTLRVAWLERESGSAPKPDDRLSGPAETDGPALVFDISDLVSYFFDTRLPTGIQRVQIEVILALLADEAERQRVRICAYSEAEDAWIEIPAALSQAICRLALEAGGLEAPDWVLAMARLDLILASTPAFRFPEGALLINLGSSWWLPNYFLHVRRAKAERGVRYVPFVHDLIPIRAPQHCVPQLTQDFIAWIAGVFGHADFYLVNSHTTKSDLIAAAAEMGEPFPADRVAVVHLDGDFRKPSTSRDGAAALERWSLDEGRFVLFVSTIESRKNHAGAFDAWLKLIETHGADAVPQLVCVGNPGWLNDAVHARLAASVRLRSHVTMLSGVSDETLAKLYRACLFTLYPSAYEGWGLPVTEALSFGKAPLVSDAASLPEVGGPFAEYFSSGSVDSLVAALERLIFDAPYRAAKEDLIARAFRPRPWREIAAQIARQADLWVDEGLPIKAGSVMPADRGVYYPAARNRELAIRPGMRSAEVFRVGAGWLQPDEEGARIGASQGEIALAAQGPRAPLDLHVGLVGDTAWASDWTLRFAEPHATLSCSGRLVARESIWLTLPLGPAGEGDIIRATLSAAPGAPLSGADQTARVGLIGLLLCEAGDKAALKTLPDAVGGRIAPASPRRT